METRPDPFDDGADREVEVRSPGVLHLSPSRRGSPFSHSMLSGLPPLTEEDRTPANSLTGMLPGPFLLDGRPYIDYAPSEHLAVIALSVALIEESSGRMFILASGGEKPVTAARRPIAKRCGRARR